MILDMKYNISTPLMMENPVKRPIVPPTTATMSDSLILLSFLITSNVGVSKYILTK